MGRETYDRRMRAFSRRAILAYASVAMTLFLGGILAVGHAAELRGREEGTSTARAHPVGAIDYLRTIDTSAVAELTKPRSFWGKLLEWVAGPGKRAGFTRPYGLTEDSEGRLIVADPGQRVVHILDFERRAYAMISGARGKEFLSPVGVAVDASDGIYVTDSARGEVYVFNRKGKFQRTLGEHLGGRMLQRPTGLAIDSKANRLYLTDTLRHQVLVLRLDGQLIQVIGRRGTGPLEFNFPTAIALVDGKLYVVDAMNFRIQVLSTEGTHIRSFGRIGQESGTLFRPKGIGVDSDGNVYVVDALFETVQVFNPEGDPVYYFGSTGTGPSQFVLPSGIYVNARDQILVADSYNRRLQVFRYRRVRP